MVFATFGSVKSYYPGNDEKAWITAESLYLLLDSAIKVPVQCESKRASISLAVDAYTAAKSAWPILVANLLAISNECSINYKKYILLNDILFQKKSSDLISSHKSHPVEDFQFSTTQSKSYFIAPPWNDPSFVHRYL
jgi:hypothetical protein